MALDLDMFAADLAEIIDDLPVDCSFAGGETFKATSTDEGQTRSIEEDGELVPVDRTIVCDAADVPAGTKPDTAITVDGKSYRVLRLSMHQDGAAAEIDLKKAYQ